MGVGVRGGGVVDGDTGEPGRLIIILLQLIRPEAGVRGIVGSDEPHVTCHPISRNLHPYPDITLPPRDQP